MNRPAVLLVNGKSRAVGRTGRETASCSLLLVKTRGDPGCGWVTTRKGQLRSLALHCHSGVAYVTQFWSSVISLQVLAERTKRNELQLLTSVRISVFLSVFTPCRPVGRYRHFEESYCLHLQGRSRLQNVRGVKTQKNAVVEMAGACAAPQK
jgi:hypothetical protein